MYPGACALTTPDQPTLVESTSKSRSAEEVAQ
jgi:hypothetical protein